MKKLLICFAAGCLGALANCLTAWAFGTHGITSQFHVAMAPALTPAWLYPKIVWGGLWGFLFAIPWLSAKPLTKGAFLSLFPTLFQFLVVFPFQTPNGYFGLKLGMYTPLFVIFYNLVWGLVTSLTIKISK